MLPEQSRIAQRRTTRRELFGRYVRLQQELAEADANSSSYQAAVQAFRQLGYALIANGFEEDLDRLLRLRVIEGGRDRHADPRDRSVTPDLLIIEQRRL